MTDLQQGIVPHLVVNDAAAAIEFYKNALGATETARMPAQDGKRLMHSQIEVNGAKLFLRDDFPEFRGGNEPCAAVLPPKTLNGTTVVMHLEVADCDAAVARAEAAGAKVILAPTDAFWGARYAQIADPFGHVWSFAHPLGASTGA
jgi:PhnB protein